MTSQPGGSAGTRAAVAVWRFDGAAAAGLSILAIITVLNLRGLGDAARAFLLPTMVFIVGLLAIIGIGLIHPLALHARQPGAVPARRQGARGLREVPNGSRGVASAMNRGD